MKTSTIWILIASGVFFFDIEIAISADGNVAQGSIKFEACRGCHGRPGVANVYPRYNVPKIAGQHATYIVTALKAYSSGVRAHASMEGNALSLDEVDMADIASYLEKSPFEDSDTPITGNTEIGKNEAEPCMACHGDGGNSSDPNFPRLARQYQSYLEKALKDYRDGDRKNAIMGSMVENLSDEDIENIASYYAGQKNGLSVVND